MTFVKVYQKFFVNFVTYFCSCKIFLEDRPERNYTRNKLVKKQTSDRDKRSTTEEVKYLTVFIYPSEK